MKNGNLFIEFYIVLIFNSNDKVSNEILPLNRQYKYEKKVLSSNFLMNKNLIYQHFLLKEN